MTADIIVVAIVFGIALILLPGTTVGAVFLLGWSRIVFPRIEYLHSDVTSTLREQDDAKKKVTILEGQVAELERQINLDRETYKEGITEFMRTIGLKSDESAKRLTEAFENIEVKDRQIEELKEQLEEIRSRNALADTDREKLNTQYGNLYAVLEKQMDSHERTIRELSDVFQKKVDSLQLQILEVNQRLTEQRAMLVNVRHFLEQMSFTEAEIEDIILGKLSWEDVKEKVRVHLLSESTEQQAPSTDKKEETHE